MAINTLDNVTGALSSLGDVSKTAVTMKSAHTCALCILRFLQIPIGPVYLTQALDTINRALGIESSEPSVNGSTHCPVCLGILDMALVDKVVGQFKEQEYDASSAAVTVELPKSVYVRHHSMQLYLKGTNLTPATGVATDLKDVIRYMVCQVLSKHGVETDADSDMRIEIGFGHEESANEHQFLFDRENSSVKTKTFRKRGVHYTTGDSKTAVISELSKCSDSEFTSLFASPPPAIERPAEIASLVLKRSPIFIGGRYLKLERNISQTPFFVGERRVTELSIADVVGEPIKALVRCDSYNLVGSGREDADVRMLGDGRPFYLECTNPRSTTITPNQIQAIEDQLRAIKSPVQVRLLQMIRPEDTAIIREGEEHKTKHYCALVWFASPLSQDKIAEINAIGKQGVLLQQKTPIRVLHRRAPLTRERRLLGLELVPLEGHFYRLRLESEAGTYIKEFVHGDLGRTAPSLAHMAGVTADIIELDVENVSLDFPPAPADGEHKTIDTC
ncbi:hypothetical protein IWW39_005842 [Coemansia spiralis]|uniref:tRNA pseudouridine(55) synthase n=1 Tax=Coemansia spiralis TaxID=417178 RepID=A0A9W8GEE9_9FUNG|nr:hypothetical protein IWW39_005842 [Coemansia spiralis]